MISCIIAQFPDMGKLSLAHAGQGFTIPPVLHPDRISLVYAGSGRGGKDGAPVLVKRAEMKYIYRESPQADPTSRDTGKPVCPGKRHRSHDRDKEPE